MKATTRSISAVMLVGAGTLFLSMVSTRFAGRAVADPIAFPDDSNYVYGVDRAIFDELYSDHSPLGNEACGLPICFPESWTAEQIRDFLIENYLDPDAWDYFKNDVVYRKCDTELGIGFIDRCEAGGGAGLPNWMCLNGWELEAFIHEAAHSWHFTYWTADDRGSCQWGSSSAHWTENWGDPWEPFLTDLEQVLFDGECEFSRDCAEVGGCALNTAMRDAYPEFYAYLHASWMNIICDPDPWCATFCDNDLSHMYANIASWMVSCSWGGGAGVVPPEILAWYDGFLAVAAGYGPPDGCESTPTPTPTPYPPCEPPIC